MYNVPNDWKLGNYMELSPEEKLKWLHSATEELKSATAELEEEISHLGGSTVSVTAEYTQQTYNNKLATITVDETATDIYAPKVRATNSAYITYGARSAGSVHVGNTTTEMQVDNEIARMSEVYNDETTKYELPWSWYDLYTMWTTYEMLPVLVETTLDDVTGEVDVKWVWCDELKSEYDSVGETWTYTVKFGNKTYTANDQYDESPGRSA